VEGANLAVAISSLRKSLQNDGTDGTLIATVPGQGYRFTGAVTWEPTPAPLAGSVGSTPPGIAPMSALATHRPWWRGTAAMLTALLLAVATSGAAFWYFRLLVAQEATVSAVPFTPPPHSVAVLAFANLSSDPKQDYLSDGLSEELTDSLCQIGALHVAARLSAFSFKAKPATIQDIARRLNVASVLRGSVRRDNGRLVVTAELMDGVSGGQLWSHTYDRDAGDALKVQVELAQAVSSALQVTLTGGNLAKLTLGGTTNPAAWDAYLRAIAVLRTTDRIADGHRKALPLLDKALALDPNFALAQARRAISLLSLAATTGSQDKSFVPGLRDAAWAAANKAVAMAPELAEAHLAVAYTLDNQQFNVATQEAEFARARELAPGDSGIAADYGRFEIYAGHTAAGAAAAEQAVALDPIDPRQNHKLAWALYHARMPDEAVMALRHSEELGEKSTVTISALRGLIALMKGDAGAALGDCKDDTYWMINLCLAIAYHSHGETPAAMAQLAKLRAFLADDGAINYAEVYAQWGDTENALYWLEKAYASHDGGMIGIRSDWMLDPIRNTPRYKAIERQMNFPP
jgi:serine/threonine-protein kinase